MNLQNLLLLPLGDTKITEFLKTLDPQHEKYKEIKTFKDCIFHNYKPLGISFQYLQKDTKWVLDSIFLYNENEFQYKKYKGPIPHDIKFSNNNVDIVKRFGEPEKKGGKTIPVWISYTKLGIQIDFKYKSFDDLNNPISFITVFPPE